MSVKMSATAVSQRLALRLLQNWTEQHPTDTSQTPTTATAGSQQPGVIDDSLTSLTWLQNLNVMKLAPGSSNGTSGRRTPTSGSGGQVTGNRPTGAVQPIQQQEKSVATHHAYVDPNAILDMTGAGSSATAGGGGRGSVRVKTEPGSPPSSSPPLPRLSPPPPPGDGGDTSPPLPSLQRSDCGAQGSSAKPSHSYATLICMAMNDSPDQRVTLSNIYSWILDNFPYFRTADPSWQNSIRHILSLNKCFQRIQREKSDPGKGSYWTIDPDFQSIVDRDFFRKRPATATASGGGQTTKKMCRRSTLSEGQQASSSTTSATRRDSAAATEDKFLSHLSGDDDNDTLKDGLFLDMSWSTILGRSLSCPSGQSLELPQPTADSRPQRDNGESSASDIRPVADNDAELAELIRACTSGDPGILDDIGEFALDVPDSDSLDLTIHGIGLRPPDWWSSPNSSFHSGSEFTSSSGIEAAVQRQALNTPSPGPDEQEVCGGQQQQQPHPWAENTGSVTMSSLDSSLVTLGLLLDGPQTPFDSDLTSPTTSDWRDHDA